MNCKCGSKMHFGLAWESPHESLAFNIYLCVICGRICKETVGEKKTLIWITAHDVVTKGKGDI